MGACLGSLLGSCVGSCAIGACCSTCLLSPKCTNLMYVLMLVVGTIVGVGLRYGGIDLNIGFDVGISGPSICTPGDTCDPSGVTFALCNSTNCKGYWAVYRIAFTLAGFFLLMTLLTTCKGGCSTKLHRGYWFGKVVLLVGTFVGSLFAPNALFAYFAWISRAIAPLFLLYQAWICIDFGYNLNSALIEKDERQDVFFGCENGGSKYHTVNLLLALGLYAGAFSAIGVMYAEWELSCAFNSGAITITLLFGLLNTAISISSIAEHGSILCSGMMFLYTTWLTYSSISALPEVECDPSAGEDHVGWLIVSIAVASLSLAYIAYRQGSKAIGGNKFKGGKSEAPAIELSTNVDHSGGGGGGGSNVVVGNDQLTHTVQVDGDSTSGFTHEELADESYGGYHLRMLWISMYMAMMLTDWGVPAQVAEADDQQYSKGYASAWLQLVTNWVCNLLYFWTLIAVKACPDRDFS